MRATAGHIAFRVVGVAVGASLAEAVQVVVGKRLLVPIYAIGAHHHVSSLAVVIVCQIQNGGHSTTAHFPPSLPASGVVAQVLREQAKPHCGGLSHLVLAKQTPHPIAASVNRSERAERAIVPLYANLRVIHDIRNTRHVFSVVSPLFRVIPFPPCL